MIQPTASSNNPLLSTGKSTRQYSTKEAIPFFEIHAIERLETQDNIWNTLPDRTNRYELVWIRKGTGIISIDCQHYDVSNNVIYCLAPGHVRQCHIESHSEGYYISFTNEFIQLAENYKENFSGFEQYNNFNSLTIVQTDMENQHEMGEIARQMNKEFLSNFLMRPRILRGLLYLFILYFPANTMAIDTFQNREKDLVRKFMMLLRTHFITKKKVSDYANDLSVTPSYLNCIVKKVSGYTVSHHIQQQIILEAKRHAMYSGTSMKQIAYHLGFDSMAHFSKFFKNNSGMNFTEFKRSI